MSFHLSEEKCRLCGLCCEQIPKIYLFPEEIARVQQIAVELEKRIVLHLEDVVLDKKNQEVLILRYMIEKDTTSSHCPFYRNETRQCQIFESRPMICKALPLFGVIDSGESAALSILGKCGEEFPADSLDQLASHFPTHFEALQDYFTRYHQSLTYIDQFVASGEIELDTGTDPSDAQEKIRQWHKIDLKPNGV